MENKKAKILEYLYVNGINHTGNRKFRPKDNDDIIKPLGLSNIGMNFESDFNQLTIRVQFSGSGKFYTMGIDINKKDYWFKTISEFIVEKPFIDFDNFDDEESEYQVDEIVEVVVKNNVEEQPIQRKSILDKIKE